MKAQLSQKNLLPLAITGGCVLGAVLGWLPWWVAIGGAIVPLVLHSKNEKQDKKGGRFNFLLFVLSLTKWVLLISMLWILRLNVAPYIEIVAEMSGQNAAQTAWLGNLPFIGGALDMVFNGARTLLTFLAGVSLWAVIQICEVLVLLVMGDGEAVQILIRHTESLTGKALRVSDNDSDQVKWIKHTFNALSLGQVRWLWAASVVAYAVDIFLVIRFYPPVEIGRFNLENLLLMAWLVIGFELFMGVYFKVDSLLHALKDGAKNNG